MSFSQRALGHLQLFVTLAASVGVVLSFLAWLSPKLFPDWAELPAKVVRVERQLDEVLGQIGDARPSVMDFRGGAIVAEQHVQQGDSITVVYVMRRTIDCQTTIRVRFFDHRRNTILSQHSNEVAGNQPPVSSNYSAFHVPVLIPTGLPPGAYSYFPEIIPIDCGIYGVQVPPISEAFTVLPKA